MRIAGIVVHTRVIAHVVRQSDRNSRSVLSLADVSRIRIDVDDILQLVRVLCGVPVVGIRRLDNIAAGCAHSRSRCKRNPVCTQAVGLECDPVAVRVRVKLTDIFDQHVICRDPLRLNSRVDLSLLFLRQGKVTYFDFGFFRNRAGQLSLTELQRHFDFAVPGFVFDAAAVLSVDHQRDIINQRVACVINLGAGLSVDRVKIRLSALTVSDGSDDQLGVVRYCICIRDAHRDFNQIIPIQVKCPVLLFLTKLQNNRRILGQCGRLAARETAVNPPAGPIVFRAVQLVDYCPVDSCLNKLIRHFVGAARPGDQFDAGHFLRKRRVIQSDGPVKIREVQVLASVDGGAFRIHCAVLQRNLRDFLLITKLNGHALADLGFFSVRINIIMYGFAMNLAMNFFPGSRFLGIFSCSRFFAFYSAFSFSGAVSDYCLDFFRRLFADLRHHASVRRLRPVILIALRLPDRIHAKSKLRLITGKRQNFISCAFDRISVRIDKLRRKHDLRINKFLFDNDLDQDFFLILFFFCFCFLIGEYDRGSVGQSNLLAGIRSIE